MQQLTRSSGGGTFQPAPEQPCTCGVTAGTRWVRCADNSHKFVSFEVRNCGYARYPRLQSRPCRKAAAVLVASRLSSASFSRFKWRVAGLRGNGHATPALCRSRVVSPLLMRTYIPSSSKCQCAYCEADTLGPVVEESKTVCGCLQTASLTAMALGGRRVSGTHEILSFEQTACPFQDGKPSSVPEVSCGRGADRTLFAESTVVQISSSGREHCIAAPAQGKPRHVYYLLGSISLACCKPSSAGC